MPPATSSPTPPACPDIPAPIRPDLSPRHAAASLPRPWPPLVARHQACPIRQPHYPAPPQRLTRRIALSCRPPILRLSPAPRLPQGIRPPAVARCDMLPAPASRVSPPPAPVTVRPPQLAISPGPPRFAVGSLPSLLCQPFFPFCAPPFENKRHSFRAWAHFKRKNI